MFKQVTIIGFGLIGSSIARAIIEHKQADTIVCVDSEQEVCNKSLAFGIADDATIDPSLGVEGSDLVILACPVGAIADIGARISGHLQKDAIVSDASSVKGAVIEALRPRLPSYVHLVPAHPISGAEKTGPESGFAELFQNRWCIITPLPNTELLAMEKVTKLWESFGSMVEIMDPEHHDLVLGLTSHLPHLIAYSVVGTATDLEDDIKSEVIKFSAGGFRDFTRIAASDPTMWRDVFLNNKEAVLEVLQRFNEDLTSLQKAIRKGDGEYLYRQFTETRDIRRAIIDAGQADYLDPES
jgi:cyclohexadieny/prephenate dehydrogenase